MLIVGAKGMAKELLHLLVDNNISSDLNLIFFDNVSNNVPDLLYNRFKILKDFESVKKFFEKRNQYTLGIGNPMLRVKMYNKFNSLGGEIISVISKNSNIGVFGTTIGRGSIIMPGVVITNDVKIGKGVLININSSISHDSEIGDFSELACGVVVPGRCKIGKKVFIGSNATLNPDLEIGEGAIIGAGAVVIKNVPAYSVVVGNPAKIIKYTK